MDIERLWEKLEKIDGKIDGLASTMAGIATRAETAHTRLNGLAKDCQSNRSLTIKLFVASLGLIAVVFGIVQASS